MGSISKRPATRFAQTARASTRSETSLARDCPTHPFCGPGNSTVFEIHKFLKTLAHCSRVLNLRNTKGDLQGEFDFRVTGHFREVREGAIINFEFKNLQPLGPHEIYRNKRRSLYFSLFHLSVARNVLALQLNGDEESVVVVAPGETFRSPDIRMHIDENNGDGTEITEIFKLIVTENPTNFSCLETEHAIRGGDSLHAENGLRAVAVMNRGPGLIKWQTA
ncbi:hypothetical protein ACMFMG_003161 [Clarireedia jacksonii]